jgi:Flp pilus assembly protein protease CpaA
LCANDLRRRRLPNVLTLGGAAAALAALWGAGGVAVMVDGLLAGLLCALFLLIPFFLRAAGGGDVKMLFACGIIAGMSHAMALLLFMSFAGFMLAVVMAAAGRVDLARLKHAGRCLFDWRYDRRAGRAALPPRESERGRVPFGLAIAAGLVVALGWEACQ